ncbi:MAG TPA: carboxypeptidase regulatory-like domain-containing protein [Pyrinomonadaceae bacterium]
MKIRIAIALAGISVCVAVVGIYFERAASAQGWKRPDIARSAKRSDELADAIKSRTSRESKGLLERSTKGGGIALDLEARFENVMLAKIDSYGEPVAACVTDLGEANSFFGRDLETGQEIASADLFANELEKTARQHGMSVPEYRFYSGLATEFASGNIITSPASATFNIVNNDGAGEGFNEATAAFVVGEGGNMGTTRGQQRLNVFNAAAAVWAAFLDSSVPTNVRSEFNVIAGCTTSGGVLGSAGTLSAFRDFSGAEFANTWYHGALANKQAGSDLDPSSPEMRAQFNTDIDSGCLGSGTRFYYGLDNATPSGRINLFVVVLHEIGHGVGFSSFVNGTTGGFLGTPTAYPDVYARNMYDATVGLHWHQMTNGQRQTSATNTNNVYWDGPSVRLESSFLTAGRQASTGRVALYTPNPMQGGSSISHFSTAASPNLLMEPNINSGLPLTLDLARQVMRDIGWYRDTTADNVADTITSVVPNGASVQIGEVQTIFWTNGGGFNRNVTIELSTDGGTSYSTIATDIVNNGTYSWNVPNTPTAQARIRVRETGFASPSGISSSNFSILAAPSSAPASISGRVLRSSGRVVANAIVTFVADNGSVHSARTNSFGYYRINDLSTGRTYIGSASAKGLSFPSMAVDLSSDLQNIDFLSSN